MKWYIVNGLFLFSCQEITTPLQELAQSMRSTQNGRNHWRNNNRKKDNNSPGSNGSNNGGTRVGQKTWTNKNFNNGGTDYRQNGMHNKGPRTNDGQMGRGPRNGGYGNSPMQQYNAYQNSQYQHHQPQGYQSSYSPPNMYQNAGPRTYG